MATRYFANSVDQNWDTLGNWWSNAACDEGFAGTLTGVTVTDTDETVTCDNTIGLVVGRPITGTGIDTGTTVASITNGTEFELSLPAIANGSSNLTCEMHEFPAAADDVVIATGNGTVGGTPPADVFGLVTVNGDSVLSAMLEAASFAFNDTSHNDGVLTGNCTFNDTSYNGLADIYGNATLNDSSYNAGTITATTIEFNDNSFNGLANVSSGYITGDCWFYNSSFNEYNGNITGNATFTESEYSTALQGPQGWSPGSGPQLGYVSGTVTFSSLTPVKFTLETGEVWRVDTTGWVFDTAGQNWEFNGESYNDTYGTINGACVFNGGPSYPIPYQNQGTVNGNCVFNVYYGLATGAVVNGDCVFNSTIVNGTITGNCTFNGYSFCNQDLVIIGNCTLNDTAVLDGTITGDCEFNSDSYNYGADITGNCTFTNTAFSTATTIYFNPQQGTVSGSVAFPNGATFTLESGESWTVDTTYWGGTLAWVFNGTSVYDDSTGSIYGDCTFNDYSQTLYGAIYGNPTFNDYSFNGCTVYGHPTFNDYSYNGSLVTTPDGGNTGGSATFNDNSYNVGTIWYTATFTNTAFSTATTGFFNPQQGDAYSSAAFPNGATFTLAGSESWDKDAQTWSGTLAWEFNDTSFNDTTGSIYGDCIFDDSSYNYGDVYGNCVFTGNSLNGDSYNATVGTVTGDFQWGSSDYNYGTITGDCVGGAVLNEYPGVIHGNCTVGTGGTVAQNASIINGDCDFLSGRYQYGTSGEINGNVTFSGNRVYGYGGMNGGVINGDVTFSDNTIHDGGTINGAVTFNDSSESQSTINGPVTFNDSAGHDTSNYTITGDCTFNDSAYTYNATAGITGNCTFNDNSYAYSTAITGNCTFNDGSYVQISTVTGNATFTNTTFPVQAYVFNPQQGTVSGTVDFPNGATFTLIGNQTWTVDTSAWTGTLAWKFYDDSSNGGTLNGNATVRQHAAAFTAWRDYATSTYITGTLTLQFPEMDILGSGLL